MKSWIIIGVLCMIKGVYLQETNRTAAGNNSASLFDADSDEAPEGGTYCPSFCDNNGDQHQAQWCVHPPLCCMREETPNNLFCCYDEELSVSEREYEDAHNCPDLTEEDIFESWHSTELVIAGISIFVILLTLMGLAGICIYKTVSHKHYYRRQTFISSASSSLGTTPLNSGASVVDALQSAQTALSAPWLAMSHPSETNSLPFHQPVIPPYTEHPTCVFARQSVAPPYTRNPMNGTASEGQLPLAEAPPYTTTPTDGSLNSRAIVRENPRSGVPVDDIHLDEEQRAPPSYSESVSPPPPYTQGQPSYNIMDSLREQRL